MAQTLEDIRKEFESMSEAELVELISHNRRERSTVTTDKIKAVRKKARTKNITAAVDGMSDELLLELAKRRGLSVEESK